MKINTVRLLSLAVTVAFAPLATAGKFEVWTQASGSGSVALVSYQGDGTSQEAQLDMTYPAGMKVSAQTKVAGSVCAVFPSENKIRIVPPSGAGTALSSNAIDYCSFSFKGAGADAPELKKVFSECVPADACQISISSTESK